MRQIIAIMVIFAVHHELTEIILTTGNTANEQTQLDSRRNTGTPPTFYFIREEAGR